MDILDNRECFTVEYEGEDIPVFLTRKQVKSHTYNLAVHPARQQEEVLFDGENIRLIICGDRSREHREKLIESWYQGKAGSTFIQSLDKIYPLPAGHAFRGVAA